MSDNPYAEARNNELEAQLTKDMLLDILGALKSIEIDLETAGLAEIKERIHKEAVLKLHNVISRIEYGL